MASAEAAAAQAEAKRPASSYFLWLKENRDEVVKALGGVQKGSEVSKKAGEMWKALSDADKAPYERRAEEAKTAWQAQKPAKAEKAEKAEKEDGPEARKKPMTPVFAFIQAKRAEIAASGVTGLGAISKRGTEMYKALPEEEQAKWQKKYEEEMKEYKAWAEGEEGKAALADKKGAAKEKREAKKEKEEKKAAKQARKEKRAGGAGAAGEAADEAAEEGSEAGSPAPKAAVKADAKADAKAAQGKAKASPKKRAADAPADGAPSPKAAKGKGRGRAAGAGAGQPTVDPAVLKEAEALGEANGVSYAALLQKLMGTDDVKGKVSDAAALAALKNSNGLLNKARAELKAQAGTAGA